VSPVKTDNVHRLTLSPPGSVPPCSLTSRAAEKEERPSTFSLESLPGDFPTYDTILGDVAGHLSGAPLEGTEPNFDPATNAGSTPYPRRARIDPRVNRLPGVTGIQSGAGNFPGLTGAGQSMPGSPGTGHFLPKAGHSPGFPGPGFRPVIPGPGNFPAL